MHNIATVAKNSFRRLVTVSDDRSVLQLRKLSLLIISLVEGSQSLLCLTWITTGNAKEDRIKRQHSFPFGQRQIFQPEGRNRSNFSCKAFVPSAVFSSVLQSFEEGSVNCSGESAFLCCWEIFCFCFFLYYLLCLTLFSVWLDYRSTYSEKSTQEKKRYYYLVVKLCNTRHTKN